MSALVRALLLSLATVMTLTACDNPQQGGRVAVLDLAQVADATGQDEGIREQAEAGREQLMNQLQQLAADLDEQLAAERDKAGATPSDEDSQRLQQLTQEARQRINLAQQQAQQQANQMESDLVFEFRDRVLPIAQDIARKQGMTLILSNDAYVFWADDSVDITAAVITAWREQDAAARQGADTAAD